MMDCWRYDVDRLPPSSETDIDLVRVCSYEEQLEEALGKCRKIKELGYEVSLNVICTSYIDVDSFVKIREKLLTEDFLDFLCLLLKYLYPQFLDKLIFQSQKLLCIYASFLGFSTTFMSSCGATSSFF